MKKYFASAFAPTKKLLLNYVSRTKGLEEKYHNEKIPAQSEWLSSSSSLNLNSSVDEVVLSARYMDDKTKFEQDKITLQKGKKYNKLRLFNPTNVVPRKFQAQTAKYKQYKQKLQSAIKKEQECKLAINKNLDNAFYKFLCQEKSRLAKVFIKKQRAQDAVKSYFANFVNPDSNQHQKGIEFSQIINKFTTLLLQEKSFIFKDSINVDVASNEFLELIFASHPQVEQYFLNNCNNANSENINFNDIKVEIMELIQNYYTLNTNKDKYEEEIDKWKQNFMQSPQAQEIQKNFIEQSTPYIATIAQNQEYYNLYAEQVDNLASTLAFAGVPINQDLRKDKYDHKVAKYGLMPFSAISAGASAIYGACSNKPYFHSAGKINKQARLIDAYHATHLLNWQHSQKISDQTLVVQQQIEKLSYTLQNKFQHNPYIKTYSVDQNTQEYIQQTQNKLDALNFKTNRRVKNEINNTVQDLSKHITVLKKLIEQQPVADSDNSDLDGHFLLQKNRDNLEHNYQIQKLIHLIKKRAQMCLKQIGEAIEVKKTYSDNTGLSLLDDDLKTIQVLLNNFANVENIADIADIKGRQPHLINNYQKLLKSLNSLYNRGTFNNFNILNENVNLENLNINAINSAIEFEEKAELEELVRKLYGTNNSKNFKLVMANYLKQLKIFNQECAKNIDPETLSGNLPYIAKNKVHKTHFKLLEAETNIVNKKIAGKHKVQQVIDAPLMDGIDVAKAKALNAISAASLGVAHTAIKIADYAPKKIAQRSKNAAINTAKSIPWAAKETIIRHKGGFNTLAKLAVKPLKFLEKRNEKISTTINHLGANVDKYEYSIKNKHTQKMNYGGMRGMTRYKQRNRRADNVAKELTGILQTNYAINSTQGIENKETQTNDLFSALRNHTRHMYENTNIVGQSRRQLFVEDLLEGTLKKTIAEFWHKNVHGSSYEQKQQVLHSFMQSYAGGKYISEDGQQIQMSDASILEAMKSIQINTNLQAQFISKAILSLYLPVKLASNYIGLAIYKATGSPLILFINVPGNPIDDILVLSSSAIISGIASLFSTIFTKEFNQNKEATLNQIQQALHPLTSIEASFTGNPDDDTLTNISQILGQNTTNNNLENDDHKIIHVSSRQFAAEMLGQLGSQMSDNLNKEQENNLKELCKMVMDIDSEKMIQNHTLNKKQDTPEDVSDLPLSVQRMNQGIANIPVWNNFKYTEEADITQKNTNLNPAVTFSDQVTQPTFEDLEKLSYSMIGKHSRTIGTPVALPLFLATSALASMAAITAVGAQSISDKISSVKKTQRKGDWGQTIADFPQTFYDKISENYNKVSQKNNQQAQLKGRVAGVEHNGLEVSPRAIASYS